MSEPANLKENSPPPVASPHPSNVNGNNNQPQNGERRTSFNFLRRQKSTEAGKMLKKQRGASGQLQQANIPKVPPQLPSHSPLSKLPGFGGENARPDSYQIATNSYQQSAAAGAHSGMHQTYGHPVPPMTSSSPGMKNDDHTDPYARTESMTHRGRYSYASSAISTGTGINSPRRVRRRKDPTPFNILVIGEQNSGKTSFIDFLRNALVNPSRKHDKTPSPPHSAYTPDSPFTPHYLETDVDHERIGVTLWDSQGLEKKFVDLQLREMASFLESKFEETFTEEQKVVRAPGVRDTHIHCVFLILDPVRLNANVASTRKLRQAKGTFDEAARLIGALDEDLDIQVLRTLQGKTTVIPVISKADTITTTHMALLKRSVWDSLKQAKLDPLEALNIVEDEDEDGFDERDEDAYLQSGDEEEEPVDIIDNLLDRSSSDDEGVLNDSTPPTSPPRSGGNKDAVKAHRRSMSDAISAPAPDEIPFLPMSIISPDTYEAGIVGRRFPWGFADPYNSEHCDFVRLKDAVFSEWRGELREASREVWYEGWRTSRLKRREKTPSAPAAAPASTYRKSSATGTNGSGLSSSPEMARGAYRQGVAF